MTRYQLTITKKDQTRERIVTALGQHAANNLGERWAAMYGTGWTFIKAEAVE